MVRSVRCKRDNQPDGLQLQGEGSPLADIHNKISLNIPNTSLRSKQLRVSLCKVFVRYGIYGEGIHTHETCPKEAISSDY